MEDNRQIDLGGFTLYDSTPFTIENGKDIESIITDRMVQNIYHALEAAINAKKQQLLAIQSLPQEEQIHDFEAAKMHFKLPEASILLPRSQIVPDPRIMTKWEKFAKDSGIKKRKRFGLKFDKELGKSVARWGSKSKKNGFEAAIMEQKTPGRNPFDDIKTEKKLAKQNQKLQELKNKDFRDRHTKK